MTLSRRDRAAMSLALECLREWARPVMACAAVRAAAEVLFEGGDCANAIVCSLPEIPMYQRSRLLRARLALYLRAMLRADRGDFGPYACPRCGCDDYEPTSGGRCPDCRAHNVRVYLAARRITPLWEREAADREAAEKARAKVKR